MLCITYFHHRHLPPYFLTGALHIHLMLVILFLIFNILSKYMKRTGTYDQMIAAILPSVFVRYTGITLLHLCAQLQSSILSKSITIIIRNGNFLLLEP